MGKTTDEDMQSTNYCRSTPQTLGEAFLTGLALILMFICFFVLLPIALGLGG